MKVLFITNIPSPYRVEFFHELGKHCSLTVWFEAAMEYNRKWRTELSGLSFAYRFLKGFTIGLDKHVNLEVIRLLKKTSYDVVVMGCYSSPTEMLAIEWLKRNRVPYLLNSDGGFPAVESSLKARVKSYFIAAATGWLSSGPKCTEYLQYYGADPKRIYEYPFSSVSFSDKQLTPPSPEELAAFKSSNNLKDNVILSVGQFIERKGYKEFLRAYKPLDDHDTTLVLIGGGPLRAEYERILTEQGITGVKLIDFLSTEELIAYYHAADLFVLPTQYDVWGLVINEAIAFGLPIVTTTGAGAGHSLVVNGCNGYLIPPDHMEQMIHCCKVLLTDRELRRSFGEYSAIRAKEFTIHTMVDKHLLAFKSFLLAQTTNEGVGDFGQVDSV